MATFETERLKITRWTDNSDNFTRVDMDDSHANLEEVVAIFTEDTDFPSGGGTDQYARSFHLDTDTNILYYSYNNGANWQPLNEFAAPTTTLTPGGSNAAGSAVSISRSDHSHALPGWGTSTQAVSTAGSAGSAGTFARSDHVHVIGSGAINLSSQFANQVVSTGALADSAVTTAKIGDQQVTRDKIVVSQRIPVGAIMPFAGSAAPTGWALCNGALKLPSDPDWSDFTALFAVISTTYGGSGGGFNLPNLTNRVPQGVGTTALAANGGGTATLTTNNLPAHTHGAGTLSAATAGEHSHGLFGFVGNPNPLVHRHRTSITAHSHGFPNGASFLYAQNGSIFRLKVADPSEAGWACASATWSGTGSAAGERSVLTASSGTEEETGYHTHDGGYSVQYSGNHSHSIVNSTASTGSGTAFNVNTAHVGMNYIIKL